MSHVYIQLYIYTYCLHTYVLITRLLFLRPLRWAVHRSIWAARHHKTEANCHARPILSISVTHLVSINGSPAGW